MKSLKLLKVSLILFSILILYLNKGQKITTLVDPKEWNVDPEGAYFYYCDNETISGFELPFVPEGNRFLEFNHDEFFILVKDQILVCDMSSNFCSKPIDVSKYGLIFAGAQKNVGPAGVTIVIIREDLLDAKKLDCTPTMCDYKILAASDSMHNTPPTYSIYVCGLYFEYLKKAGGLQYWAEFNQKKSSLIYDLVDSSNGFYNAPIEKNFRSKMNVPFRIKNS